MLSWLYSGVDFATWRKLQAELPPPAYEIARGAGGASKRSAPRPDAAPVDRRVLWARTWSRRDV